MMKKWIALSISSGLFTGFLPGKIMKKWIGTGGGLAGSSVALLIQIIVLCYNPPFAHHYMIWMVIVLCYVSFWAVPVGESFMLERWKERKKHTGEIVDHDFNETNIDEIVGQLIAGFVAFVPGVDAGTSIVILLATFALFRYLDTKKPLGIKEVEDFFERKGQVTAGIMLDDVAGGAYAMLLGVLIYMIA